MTTGSTQRTPLHAVHVAAGARMVDFAGWEMPVQYTGVLEEHQAVRTRAGLFDVSHMGEVSVRGQGALAFLQHVTCNDVAKLVPGRIQYSALMTEAGTFVDDLLVYRLEENAFLVVVNAGNAAKDLATLHARARAFDVEIEDHSARYALLAVQGPRAPQIVGALAAADLLETAGRVAAGEFHAALFSSPSTFHRLRDAGEGIAGFDGALAAMRRVAIGRVTASALSSAGLPAAAVARSASDEGLVEALLRAFSS